MSRQLPGPSRARARLYPLQFTGQGLYPLQFTGQGQPAPGGNATAFVARMSRADFGSSAARISPLGVIQPPSAG